MAELNELYETYYSPVNATPNKNTNFFNFNEQNKTKLADEIYQEHKPYSGYAYEIGLRDVFGKETHDDEVVGKMFFSRENIIRIQKQIKQKIYEMSHHRYVLEEDQDPTDLLVAMRAVYMMHGKFLPSRVVHQVKDLNKKLVDYVSPDIYTEIKQYYSYLEDVNEPRKVLDRGLNVNTKGRKTIPSITSLWSRF